MRSPVTARTFDRAIDRWTRQLSSPVSPAADELLLLIATSAAGRLFHDPGGQGTALLPGILAGAEGLFARVDDLVADASDGGGVEAFLAWAGPVRAWIGRCEEILSRPMTEALSTTYRPLLGEGCSLATVPAPRVGRGGWPSSEAAAVDTWVADVLGGGGPDTLDSATVHESLDRGATVMSRLVHDALHAAPYAATEPSRPVTEYASFIDLITDRRGWPSMAAWGVIERALIAGVDALRQRYAATGNAAWFPEEEIFVVTRRLPLALRARPTEPIAIDARERGASDWGWSGGQCAVFDGALAAIASAAAPMLAAARAAATDPSARRVGAAVREIDRYSIAITALFLRPIHGQPNRRAEILEAASARLVEARNILMGGGLADRFPAEAIRRLRSAAAQAGEPELVADLTPPDSLAGKASEFIRLAADLGIGPQALRSREPGEPILTSLNRARVVAWTTRVLPGAVGAIIEDLGRFRQQAPDADDTVVSMIDAVRRWHHLAWSARNFRDFPGADNAEPAVTAARALVTRFSDPRLDGIRAWLAESEALEMELGDLRSQLAIPESERSDEFAVFHARDAVERRLRIGTDAGLNVLRDNPGFDQLATALDCAEGVVSVLQAEAIAGRFPGSCEVMIESGLPALEAIASAFARADAPHVLPYQGLATVAEIAGELTATDPANRLTERLWRLARVVDLVGNPHAPLDDSGAHAALERASSQLQVRSRRAGMVLGNVMRTVTTIADDEAPARERILRRWLRDVAHARGEGAASPPLPGPVADGLLSDLFAELGTLDSVRHERLHRWWTAAAAHRRAVAVDGNHQANQAESEALLSRALDEGVGLVREALAAQRQAARGRAAVRALERAVGAYVDEVIQIVEREASHDGRREILETAAGHLRASFDVIHETAHRMWFPRGPLRKLLNAVGRRGDIDLVTDLRLTPHLLRLAHDTGDALRSEFILPGGGTDVRLMDAARAEVWTSVILPEASARIYDHLVAWTRVGNRRAGPEVVQALRCHADGADLADLRIALDTTVELIDTMMNVATSASAARGDIDSLLPDGISTAVWASDNLRRVGLGELLPVGALRSLAGQLAEWDDHSHEIRAEVDALAGRLAAADRGVA